MLGPVVFFLLCFATLVVFAVVGVYPIAAPYASLPVPAVLACSPLPSWCARYRA